MEQSCTAILEQTRLENLLKHYDINDLVDYLVTKNFLLRTEVRSILSSKQETIKFIARSDKYHSHFFQLFEQYKAYVDKDVHIALAEILHKATFSVRELQQQLPLTESESDSFSQSSFSDDSDTGFAMHSQAFPIDCGECSGMLQDSGYYTQSNTQSLSDTAQLPSLPETRCRRKKLPKKSYPQDGIKKVYITNNYYMDSKSEKRKKIFLTKQGLPMDGATEENCKTELTLKSSAQEKEKKFKNIIRRHNRDFIACMNVQSLLPCLQEQELLTTYEYEKLTQEVHTKTQSEQNHCLLRILPTKGEQAIERFLTCLTQADEHLGHEQLVKILSQQIY